tara:strand:+ start:21481 stop:21984 length:504 start_codon:yes stop_codon:yes gene_type:complete
MSNVIKAASSFSGTEQPALIGKIYEEQFTDSSGNTMVRYLRCFKADGAVAAGAVIGAKTSGGLSDLYDSGLAGTMPAVANTNKQLIAGVALAAVADGSYGFCVCQGLVEKVLAGGGTAEGEILMTSGSTAGEVDGDGTIAAGHSNTLIGVALSTQTSGTITAYINVL